MTANRLRRCQRGFTLTELMIAAAVLGLVMAGLLGLLTAGQGAYARGANTIDAQQNVRVALERMTKEIREAGYHPLPPDSSPTTCPAGGPPPGYVGPPWVGLYPPPLGGTTDNPCWYFYPIINQTATSFTLQFDWNGDGVITPAGLVIDPFQCPVVACRGEQVTYACVGCVSPASGNLTRQEVGVDGIPQILATGISMPPGVPIFTYLENDPANANNPAQITATSRDLIRSVGIVITAKMGSGASATMTDQIRLRAR